MVKKYLVTGGTGFLGSKLVHTLVNDGHKVKVVSRNEGKLVYLKEKYPTIEIVNGDISNKYVVMKSMEDVDGVFHLAAFKYVDLAEKDTISCVNSNLIGSLNILQESLNMNLDFIIATSTDKAAKVSGVYGATKFLMEKLFEEFQTLKNKTKYRIVRYGNVLYSTGSVLHKWRNLLRENKEVMVTDLNCTRFYWSIDEAIKLIFDCLKNAIDAKPYIPEMKSLRLGDLLKAMSIKYLPKDGKLKIKTIGLRVGENLHEKLLDGHKDSFQSERYTIEEIIEII